MADPAVRLVSIPEALDKLGGIGSSTLYELIKRSEIVKINIGRRSFLTLGSLDAYLERLVAASPSGELGKSCTCGTWPEPNFDEFTGEDTYDDLKRKVYPPDSPVADVDRAYAVTGWLLDEAGRNFHRELWAPGVPD